MIEVETQISGRWNEAVDWHALADRAVRSAIAHSRHAGLADRDAEFSVRFASEEVVRGLNAAWRGKDKATNVLSFPMVENDVFAATGPILMGDVVLADRVCDEEAAAAGVRIEDHAAHLVVHGTLHLLGYDHETSEASAEHMEEIERRALEAIGIADPYAAEKSPAETVRQES